MGMFSISMRKKAKALSNLPSPISEDLDVPPAPPAMKDGEIPSLESEGETMLLPPVPKKKEKHKFPSLMSRNKVLPPLPEMVHEIPPPPSGLKSPLEIPSPPAALKVRNFKSASLAASEPK